MSESPIEAWKLTAFLLNELDPGEQQSVQQAIDQDAGLKAELDSLQVTLDRARQALVKSNASIALDAARTSTVAKQIEGLASPSYWRWQAIAALAASLLLVGFLLPIGWQERMIASKPIDESGRSPNVAETASTSVADPVASSPLQPASDSSIEPSKENRASKEPAANEKHQESPAYADAGAKVRSVVPADPLKREPLRNSLASDADSPTANQSSSTKPPMQVPSEKELVDAKDEAVEVQSVRGLAADSVALTVPAALGATFSSANASSDGQPGSGGMGGGGQPQSNPSNPQPATEPGLPSSSLSAPAPYGETRSDAINLALTPSNSSTEQESYNYRQLLPADKMKGSISEPAVEQALTQAQLGDRFDSVHESGFVVTQDQPLSTFSIDVDTASYSKVRQYLMQSNTLPQPSTVRIEEFINYFDYDYAGPKDEHPFASNLAVGVCPWNENHRLIRIGLQAKKLELEARPKANLVFLLDVSGSMDEPNKLPLVKQSIALLAKQLGENDRIAIVVYAGAAGCVLPSITGDRQAEILSALDQLQAGGSTNGGQGIELAYAIARDHFVPGGINRIILCTDGDFNVGTTSTEGLVEMVERNAKSRIFLTCLGYGIGNYNDAMMEQITNRGNGTYAMVDNIREARRLMIEQLSGTLMTVAKDVKIQVEFNPAKVSRYRLIGYENRRLANADFNNDAKDAGEIGAGHRVTALYEVVPANVRYEPAVDELRYRQKEASDSREEASSATRLDSTASNEWMTLKLRYKQPEGDVSTKREFYLTDHDVESKVSDADFQWAASVAEFGLLLRRSQLAPQADWEKMIRRAQAVAKNDSYRLECIEMMIKAHALVR